jgi:hypothetical protein
MADAGADMAKVAFDTIVEGLADGADGVDVTPNGMTVSFNLMQPSTHVSPEWLLATDADDKLSLAKTIGLALLSKAVGNTVTAEVLTAHQDIIGIRISQWAIMRVLHSCGWNPVVRATDRVPHDKWQEVVEASTGVDDHAAYLASLIKITSRIIANEPLVASLATKSKFVVYALIANGIHRVQCEGHNWMTRQAKNPGSVAYRAHAVAGQDAEDFQAFMASGEGCTGHDMWHFLDEATLATACEALCGVAPIVAAVTYDGIDNVAGAGTTVADILQVSDSAKDRYPPGKLGRSALLTGLDMVVEMFTLLGAKLALPYASALVALAVSIRTRLAEPAAGGALDRAALLEVKARLTPAVCVAYGFCYGDAAAVLKAEPPASLKKFSEINSTHTCIGKAMWEVYKNMSSDKAAVKATIITALTQIGNSLASSVDNCGGGAIPAPADGDVVYEDFEVPISEADILRAQMAQGGGRGAWPDDGMPAVD